MSLQIARGVHISEDYWVGFLLGDDIGGPDVSGTKPVSTGHHVGHSHGVIDLKNKYSLTVNMYFVSFSIITKIIDQLS